MHVPASGLPSPRSSGEPGPSTVCQEVRPLSRIFSWAPPHRVTASDQAQRAPGTPGSPWGLPLSHGTADELAGGTRLCLQGWTRAQEPCRSCSWQVWCSCGDVPPLSPLLAVTPAKPVKRENGMVPAALLRMICWCPIRSFWPRRSPGQAGELK